MRKCSHLIVIVEPKNLFYELPPCSYRFCTKSDEARCNFEWTLKWWKGKKSKCWIGPAFNQQFMCSPCIASVQKGMLDAATVGGDNCQRGGEADQQHQAVDVKPE